MNGFMGHGWGMGLGWIAGLIVVIAFVWLIVRGKITPSDTIVHPEEQSALDILKKRYAKGEINKTEYEERKKDIME